MEQLKTHSKNRSLRLFSSESRALTILITKEPVADRIWLLLSTKGTKARPGSRCVVQAYAKMDEVSLARAGDDKYMLWFGTASFDITVKSASNFSKTFGIPMPMSRTEAIYGQQAEQSIFTASQLVDYETGIGEYGKGRIENIDYEKCMVSVRDEDDNSIWIGPLDKITASE